jgi:hypothetical protein
VRVDPGWWVELGVSVGADVDVPAVVVDDPVVVPAEEHQVARRGAPLGRAPRRRRQPRLLTLGHIRD